MKKIILFIGILACTLTLKATPNVTGFQILGNYLFEGKLKVNSNNSGTSFVSQISISRGQINQNGSYIDEPVDLTVEILNIDKNGVTHILAIKRYATSDFQGGFNKLETQSMTAEIPSSYYSGQIRVRYRYKFLDPNIENLYGKTSNDVYVGTTYQIITTKEIEDRNKPTIPPYDPRAVSIYIYNSKKYGDHYLTPENKPSIGSDGSYLNEGVAFYAYNTQIAGSVPIYVYNSQKYGDHYYATGNSPSIGDGNYLNEGIAFYAFPTQAIGSVPVYVYNSQKYGDHYWGTGNTPTTGADGSYKNEGIAFYAYPAR